MKKCYIILAMIFSLCIGMVGDAEAMTFDSMTKLKTIDCLGVLGGTKETVTYDQDGNTIKFVLENDVLRIRDCKNNAVLMESVFRNDHYNGFFIREIKTSNPSMIFYEIRSSCGARCYNLDFVLIGKQGNKWVKYISHESLANMGIIMENNLHYITSRFIDGKYEIHTLVQRDIPKHPFRTVTDGNFTVDWDANANWVSMTHVAK